MGNWHGILEIIEISHIRDNKVLWSNKNLKNMLHNEGEEFILKILFADLVKPEYYWFGLDNRTTLDVTDTLLSITDEPSSHGYERQGVSSSEGWAFSNVGGQIIAKSPIITFAAVGGNIGPVRNIFMTNQSEAAVPTDDDYLISTVYLGQILTIVSGDAVSLRVAIKLKDC